MGCLLTGLKPQMEQNECAQCTHDKQDGSDFSHLQESFEAVLIIILLFSVGQC